MIEAKSLVGDGSSPLYGKQYARASCQRCACPENQPWMWLGTGNYNGWMHNSAPDLLTAGSQTRSSAYKMYAIGGKYDIQWGGGTADDSQKVGVMGSDKTMAYGLCSFEPGQRADKAKTEWQMCVDPLMVSGCSRHMECMGSEFCANCEMCNKLQHTQIAKKHADYPLCGQCTNGVKGTATHDTSANPTDLASNGWMYNVAMNVQSSCAPKRSFLGTTSRDFSTELDAFGLAEDDAKDNVIQNGKCIQNCPNKGLDAVGIYPLDSFTG